jgi:cobalt-zinc-cadmium efflux system membrane fusion protein
MVHFAAKRLRGGLITIGLITAALVIVPLVMIAVRANRPAPENEAADDESAGDEVAATSVRLGRAELVRAAGIEVEPVQSRAVNSTIVCNGSAGFNQNSYVKVPPKADGVLRKINVDVGQTVHAGDVLAIVDSHNYGDLKASYIKALVHEEHLRWQVEKYRAAGEGIAAKNLFEAQHMLEEQIADTARINDRLGTFGLTADQIDELVRKKDMSIQLPVLAPRDGVIVERHAVEGEPVLTSTSLFAITDLDTMWVHLNVYESNLRHIHLNQAVTFFPDGLPGQGFSGKVTWISPEVDPQTRTIQLRAEVANNAGALRANMFGKGELSLEGAHDGLVVPSAAVQSHDGKQVVFVQKPDNLFEVRRIDVGLKDEKFWEITSGLAPGENVATTGSFLLKSSLENPEFGKVE